MKKQSALLSASLACLMAVSFTAQATPRHGSVTPELGPCGQHPTDQVNIPDENLLAELDWMLTLPEGTPVTQAQMQLITRLEADNKGITNLEGLQCATNLTELGFHGDPINDVSPLSNLPKLAYLALVDTQVSDLWPLSNLKSLQTLYLDGDGISDLRPLSGLTSLMDLRLSRNHIRDLSPLAPLVNLQNLYISSLDGLDGQNPDLSSTAISVSARNPTASRASTVIVGGDFVMPTRQQNDSLQIGYPETDRNGNVTWTDLTPYKSQVLPITVRAQVSVGHATATYVADAYYSVKWVP